MIGYNIEHRCQSCWYQKCKLKFGLLEVDKSRRPTKISRNGESQVTPTNSDTSANSQSSVDVGPAYKKICLVPKQGESDLDNDHDRLSGQCKENVMPNNASVAIASSQKPRFEITEATSNSPKHRAYDKETDLTASLEPDGNLPNSLPSDASQEDNSKQTVTCELCDEALLKGVLSDHISKYHGNISLDEYHTFASTQKDSPPQKEPTAAIQSDHEVTNNVTKNKDCSMRSKSQVISCIPLSEADVHDFDSDSSTDEQYSKPKDRVKVNTKVKSQPSQNIMEDPDLKVAEALRDYLGLSEESPFLQKSKEDQAEIGNHLEHILRVLCDSALVPLMISTLKKQDITKIAALSDLFGAGAAIKDEGEEDNDEVMARVDANLAKISNGVTNSGDDASSSSEDEKIISSEESDND